MKQLGVSSVHASSYACVFAHTITAYKFRRFARRTSCNIVVPPMTICSSSLRSYLSTVGYGLSSGIAPALFVTLRLIFLFLTYYTKCPTWHGQRHTLVPRASLATVCSALVARRRTSRSTTHFTTLRRSSALLLLKPPSAPLSHKQISRLHNLYVTDPQLR